MSLQATNSAHFRGDLHRAGVVAAHCRARGRQETVHAPSLAYRTPFAATLACVSNPSLATPCLPSPAGVRPRGPGDRAPGCSEPHAGRSPAPHSLATDCAGRHHQDRADPFLGFVYAPYAQSNLVQTSVQFGLRMDSHGFRNLGTWPARADVVVVAVGDSWVFSYGVNDDEAWPHQVERSLPGIRVINLGLAGLGPEQYTRAYERYRAPLHPKVLLYGIYAGNDLLDTADFDRWL